MYWRSSNLKTAANWRGKNIESKSKLLLENRFSISDMATLALGSVPVFFTQNKNETMHYAYFCVSQALLLWEKMMSAKQMLGSAIWTVSFDGRIFHKEPDTKIWKSKSNLLVAISPISPWWYWEQNTLRFQFSNVSPNKIEKCLKLFIVLLDSVILILVRYLVQYQIYVPFHITYLSRNKTIYSTVRIC